MGVWLVEVCAAGDRRGWVKGTCMPSKGTLGQVQSKCSRLSAKNWSGSRRMAFRPVTGYYAPGNVS